MCKVSTKVKDLEMDIWPSWKPSWENTPCLTLSCPQADPEMRILKQVSDGGDTGSPVRGVRKWSKKRKVADEKAFLATKMPKIENSINIEPQNDPTQRVKELGYLYTGPSGLLPRDVKTLSSRMAFLRSTEIRTEMQLWVAGTGMAENDRYGWALAVCTPSSWGCLSRCHGPHCSLSQEQQSCWCSHLPTPSYPAGAISLGIRPLTPLIDSIILKPLVSQSSLEWKHPK